MQTVSMPAGKLYELAKGWGKGVTQLVFAAVGFGMSGASVLTAIAPFGVAWAGAAPPGQALAAAAGAAVGYALLLRGSESLRYLASVVLLMGMRWALCFLPRPKTQFYSPLMAAIAIGATGFAAAVSGGTVYDFVLVGCEMAITATVGILFIRATHGIESGTPFSGTTGVCTGLMLAVLYMGLSSLRIAGISLTQMAAVWLLLCCGNFAGAGAGAVAGAVAGLAAALSGDTALFPVYAAGGLASGIFSVTGRFGSIAAFAAAGALGLAAGGGRTDIFPLLIEGVMGAALMIVTPLSLPRRLGLAAPSDTGQGEMVRRAVTAQLARTRDALSGIAQVTDAVSRRLEELRGDPIDRVVGRAADRVCRGCKSSPRCWQTDYHLTSDVLNAAFAVARTEGCATTDQFPPHFRCVRTERLIAALNEEARRYTRQHAARQQASQMRIVASDQFEGMSMLLDSIGREVSRLSPVSPGVTASVLRYLEGIGAAPISACCYLDAFGRSCILAELPARKAARLDLARATAELSELVAQELGIPELLPDGDITRAQWRTRTRLTLECGHVQRAAGAARLCGDSCLDFSDSSGRAVLLISDGMGVGGNAAVDATMTTSLLSRLVCAGVGFDAALRLVNAALLSGSGEERLCTVDAGVLDLFTGRLDLYKAGAAPTFVLREGKVVKIESPSLPAGILGGTEAQHSSLTVGVGDLIVMVSDGVTDSGADWVPSQIQALADRSPEELCAGLLDTAAARRIDGHEDDMTAMAAVVRPG